MANHRETGGVRGKDFLRIAIILALGALIYSNTLRVELTFDDIRVITENPAIKHLDKPLELWNYWSTRWLWLLSLALNYRAGGLEVVGYHVVNLAIHLLNGIVLFFLVGRLMRAKALAGRWFLRFEREMAFFAALLFVAQPIQTQAVTYVVQRAASLATLFYLLAMLLYVASRQNSARSRATVLYVLCISATVAGMFTKEIAFTIPLCILLYAIVLEGESPAEILRRWRHYAPILLTLIIIPATLHFSHARGIAEFSDPHRAMLRLPAGEYLVTEINVVRTYLRLLFVPLGQNLDWDYPVARSLFETRTLGSLALLLAAIAAALWLRKRNPLIAFGILWFFLALSVESSFLPLYNVIAEHRLYLPMAGFSIALVSGIYGAAGSRRRGIAVAVLCAFIAVLSILTYERNRVWQEGRIWEDVVRKSPGSARAHNNLGNWYKSKGRAEDAIGEYRRAIEIDPNYYGAYANLGEVYDRQGKADEAIQWYAKVLKINPSYAQAYNNLGVAYARRGMLDEAIAVFRRGLAFAPEDANLRANLGAAYLKHGDAQKAVVELQKAVELNPDNENARKSLERARKTLENAIKQ